MTAAEAKAEEKTLRGLFSTIDVDNDGEITKRELQAKLKADSSIQDLLVKAGGSADYVMEQLDVDGDGIITYSEFEAMLSADAGKLVEAVAPGATPAEPIVPSEAIVSMSNSVDALKKVFDSIDTSGDGKVSREELRAHMAKDDTVVALLVNAGGSRDYVFEQLNADDDSFVTWDEFKDMLSADAGGFVGVPAESTPAVTVSAPAAAESAPQGMSEEDEADALLAEATAALA